MDNYLTLPVLTALCITLYCIAWIAVALIQDKKICKDFKINPTTKDYVISTALTLAIVSAGTFLIKMMEIIKESNY
jgi:hypothetical protein